MSAKPRFIGFKCANANGRRKTVTSALLGVALSFASVHPALAGNTYPTRPITIISPFSAGGPPDALARLIATRLQEQFGQPVLIENRPGAGTIIATKAAAAAAPDGYTLLQVNSAFAYAMTLHARATYDPLKDFSPVASIATWSHFLVVPASVPASNIKELIAYAKAKPKQFNIGFPQGGPPQVLAELFGTVIGAPVNMIPYHQTPQLIGDLLAGRLDAFFGTGANLIALVKHGKLKALAYTGNTRFSELPDVPTAEEAGLPQLALNPSDWTGIVAPANTPAQIVLALNSKIGDVLRSPEVRESIKRQGGEPMLRSSETFGAFLVDESKKWPALVQAAGLRRN